MPVRKLGWATGLPAEAEIEGLCEPLLRADIVHGNVLYQALLCQWEVVAPRLSSTHSFLTFRFSISRFLVVVECIVEIGA